MKLSAISSLGLGALLLGLVQTPAMSINIDLFQDVEVGTGTEQSVQINEGLNTPLIQTNTDSNLPLGRVIGGTRYLSLSVDNNASATKFHVDSSENKQHLSLSTPSGVTSTGIVKWNGTGNKNEEGFWDLFQEGHDSFQVRIIAAELNGRLKFTVEDDNNIASSSFGIKSQESNSPPSDLFIPYNKFSNIDFAKVKSIEMEISAGAREAYDITIDSIVTAQAVPFEFSPSLGIILSSSFFGFHALRKRWKNNSSDKLIS
jgi:hypothetical protein